MPRPRKSYASLRYAARYAASRALQRAANKRPALGLRTAGSNSPGWFSFSAGLFPVYEADGIHAAPRSKTQRLRPRSEPWKRRRPTGRFRRNLARNHALHRSVGSRLNDHSCQQSNLNRPEHSLAFPSKRGPLTPRLALSHRGAHVGAGRGLREVPGCWPQGNS